MGHRKFECYKHLDQIKKRCLRCKRPGHSRTDCKVNLGNQSNEGSKNQNYRNNPKGNGKKNVNYIAEDNETASYRGEAANLADVCVIAPILPYQDLDDPDC